LSRLGAGQEASSDDKGNTEVEATIWAFVPGVTGFGITAQHHPLPGFARVGPLVSRHFVVEPQITSAVKMVAEDLAKPFRASWAIRAEG
jgi:hypothetical protein